MYLGLLGADIIMQLDDVVSRTVIGPRVEEAMSRSDLNFISECSFFIDAV